MATCIRPDLTASSAYKYAKCRCERCVAWKRDAARRTNDPKKSAKRSKVWRVANPARWAEHQRNYRARHRAPCLLCHKPLPYPSPGAKYHDACAKTVQRDTDRIRRATQREQLWVHKTRLGCTNCGYNKHGSALDWHHPDPNRERRITVRSWQTRLGRLEIAKCILLCANCHREEHANCRRTP